MRTAMLLLLLLVSSASFAQTHTEVTLEDPQTISGNKTFSGTSTFTTLTGSGDNPLSWGGSISAKRIENISVVGAGGFSTIAAALTDAGSTGYVLIRPDYAGTDAYSASSKNVIDLRGNNSFRIYQYLTTSRPITGFPLGNDLALNADGPADIYLVHDDLANAKSTTTTTISAGTQNIALGSAVANNFSTGAGVILGRETSSEEIATLNSIVDSSTLNVTATKSHSGTTDVEQLGSTVFKGGYGVSINTSTPSQLGGRSAPWRWGSSFNSLVKWPVNVADAFPFGALQLSMPITGMTAGADPTTPADLILRNADSSHWVRLETSTGTTNFYTKDGENHFVSPLVDETGAGAPAASGAMRYRNTSFIKWRNAANSADLDWGVNAADGPAFNTAALTGTVPYVMTAINLSAQSAAITPSTLRAVGANQSGLYRISWAAKVTTAATSSSTLGGSNGFQIVYTDADDSVSVTTPVSTTSTGNTTGTQISGVVIVNAKASTTIQYQFGYTSSGATAMQYALHVRIEPI